MEREAQRGARAGTGTGGAAYRVVFGLTVPAYKRNVSMTAASAAGCCFRLG
jgi:hypothetical protein